MNQQSEKLASLSLALMVLLSVFAGSLAFAGSAAAANASDYEFDEQLEDGKTYWVGMTLYSDETANNASGTTYEVHGADDDNSAYFQQVRVNSDGALLIDTGSMDAGSYYVEDADNTRMYDFEVAQQEFSVDSSDDDASDTTYTFEFDSNRVGFDVVVEADGLDADDLADAFDPASEEVVNVDDDSADEYVINDVSDGDAIDATFNEEDAGEYDFEFTVRDTGESDSLNGFEVAEPDDAAVEFEESVYSGTVGDVSSFNVTMENTNTAEVHLGDYDNGYQVNFTVTDGNEDGVVTVEFNSFTAGDGDSNNTISVADSEDSYSIVDGETVLPSPPLATGTYDMSVFANGAEQDVAALMLSDRETTGASVSLVPSGEKTNDAEDIDENAVAGDTVALGDKLVVAFEATGVFGQLEGESSASLVEGSSFANAQGMFVTVTDKNPTPNQDAEQLDVGKADLRLDAENDMFYLVFDTSDFDLEDGDEYEVYFDMTEDNPYVDDEDEADAQDAKVSFNVAERTADFDDYDRKSDVVYVNPDEAYVVSGTTTVAPGSELTIVARAEGDAPFLYDEDVVVAEDGTFSAEFDFSGLADGSEFDLEVSGFDAVDAVAVDSTPEQYDVSVVTVDENGEDVDATVSVDGDAFEGDLTLANGTYTVTASADGYADASEEVTVDGDSQSVTLALSPAGHALSVTTVDENGEAVDATVTVDGEAYDGDALQDGTYTVNASADGYEAVSQEVTIDGAAQSVTLTLASEDAGSETPDSPDDVTTTTTPGFGLVVALVAIVAAAMLARRQD